MVHFSPTRCVSFLEFVVIPISLLLRNISYPPTTFLSRFDKTHFTHYTIFDMFVFALVSFHAMMYIKKLSKYKEDLEHLHDHLTSLLRK